MNLFKNWFFGAVFAALSISASAADFSGTVSRIKDGDTLVVVDADDAEHHVRMIGIDAPEMKQTFGKESALALSDLVLYQLVTVAAGKPDRYGRIMGKVLLDGVDINLLQVSSGMAWFYAQYQRYQTPADRKIYAAAEQEARAANRGLWVDPYPVAPWVIRKHLSGK